MKRLIMFSFLFFMLTQVLVAQVPNTLTKQEVKDGWVLLFDGVSTKGWRNYNKTTIGDAWKVVDGTLYLDKAQKDDKSSSGGGDIITEKQYENYELSLEWKIQPCGNSGVMFNVQESEKNKYPWLTGPEMQVLDNACHPDAKIVKHRAGDLYDMISCSTETVKPAGEWNVAKIVSKNGNYEFWLNGTKTVQFIMHTPEWDAMVANSKFKTFADFGKSTKGHIALQDHSDQVWFRNIKIKELK